MALLFVVFILVFFTIFFLAPIGTAVVNAFCVQDQCSYSQVILTFTSSRTLELFLNSFNIAFYTTFFVILIATPLALIMTKRSFPGKSIFHLLFLTPFLLPPFVGALALKQLLGRFGSVNLLLLKLNIIGQPIDWIGSFPQLGIIVVQTLHLYPFLYLIILSTLKNFDSNLEESALTLGLSRFKAFLKILIPMLKPSVISAGVLTFIASFTDLGTPLFFEFRKVIPAHLFYLMNDSIDNSESYSLILYITVFSVFLFIISKTSASDQSKIQSKGYKPYSAYNASILETLVLYPCLLTLVLLSLMPHIGITMLAVSQRWFMSILPEGITLDHFYTVLTHPLSFRSLRTSLYLSSISASLDLIIGVPIAYIIVRGKRSLGWILEALNSLPLAIPGIIVAFAYISFFSKTPLDNRVNPIPLLIIAYTIRRLPFMVRSVVAGLQDAKVTLEEAAATCGLSNFKIAQKITLPLILPHIVSGTLLCFAFAVIEVSDSIILALEEKFYPVSKALLVLSGRPDGTPLASALAFIVMILIGTTFAFSSYLTRSNKIT